MQNDDTYFRLKEISKYDNKPFVTQETRKAIMDNALTFNPRLEMRGGTRHTNPYKPLYDLAIAEKLARVELLQESKLWSPRFTPAKFKYLWVLPLSLAMGLMVYLHYVQIPKRMLYLKNKSGFVFKDLEGKGFLKDWIVNEYEDDIYETDVLKELEELTDSGRYLQVQGQEPSLVQDTTHLQQVRVASERAKMGVKLNNLYTKRKLDKEKKD